MAQAQGGPVVFSQVYGGGGGTTVTNSYQRDFVELFNRSASPVDISGYSIQYASAAGTTGSYNAATVIPMGTILQPGQYYLVGLGTASTGGAPLPTPDFSGSTTTNLAAAAGRVALVNNSTALSVTAAANAAGIVDFVGYGTTSVRFEGTGPTANTSGSTSALRLNAGCTDTDDNAADFVVGTTVAPRSMATTLAPCGGAPTPQEINVQQSGTNFLTGSTYSGFSNTVVGSSNVRTFTVQNLGGTALTVSNIALSGANAGDYSLSALTPASPVAPNSSATFNVTFAPTAAGTRTAVLTITNNDADEGSYVINLSAMGQASLPNPEINVQVSATDYLTGSTYAFGSTLVGTPVTATFTVQNTSTTDVLSVSAQGVTGSTGAGFTMGGTAVAPYTVAPNSSTTFTVTFNPTSSGSKTGTITITSDDQDESTYTILLTGTATNPAPTLTSASPTNILVGISSVVTLTGTNMSGATVNFNGGTLTPSSTSSTSATVRITAPSAGTFPVSVTTSAGTSGTVNLTATMPPAGFFEPFEAATQSSYVTTAPGVTLALTTGNWQIFQGLLTSTDASDKKNNAQSVRLRGGGTLEMLTEKTNGAGVVSLYAAAYGTDATSMTPSSFTLSYSTDNGMTFTDVPGTPAAGTLTGTLTQYSYTLNVPGNIRLRISNTNTVAASNPRINIDDIQITDFTGATNLTVSTTQAIPAGTYNNITVTGTGVATLSGNVVVNGTFLVQSGGTLTTDCTNTITGTGAFTLAAGATLTICDPAGITASGATGAIRMSGTRSFSNTAIYRYVGTAAQVTGSGLPSQVRTLFSNSTVSLTLSSPLSIMDNLFLVSGTLNTANQLTLMSSASGTASVGRTSGSISGSATVQRYIDPSLNAGAGYRHYSAPVQSTTFADLTTAGFTPVLNTAYNSSTTPNLVTPFPNVFGYDESRVITSPSTTYMGFDKGWFVPTGTMEQGRGYSVNIAASQLVDFVGTLEFGNVNKTLTRNSLNSATESGWHLLGNPYAAPLNMSTITVPAGINSAIYVFRSTSQYNGNYRAYVNGVGGNPIVSVAQGFFVQATTNGAVFPMSFANTTTSASNSQDVFQRSIKPLVQLNLRDDANTLSDEAYVYFEQGATAGFDARFDAEKLPNTHGLNLASSNGTNALAINGLPVLSSTVIVPLTVNAPAAGSYVLEAAQLANLAAGTVVTLHDALTGARMVLTAGSSYAFSLATTSATGRFSLEFQPAAAPLATAAQALAAQVQVYPNPASGSFQLALPLAAKGGVATLTNALGQTVLTRTLTGTETTFDVHTLAAGVYNLHLNVEGTKVVRRVVVK
ncbi:choice-of-anchor D domain-containing protein [Hymenobacter saemangeumensis]